MADFGEGGALSFVSDAKAGKVSERWHLLLVTFMEEKIGKFGVICLNSSLNDRMVRLKRLDKDFGLVKMPASNASDYLSEKLESAFFASEVG